MKRPRACRRWLVPLSFLLIPPTFWSLVLGLTPTEWARVRIVQRVAQASGRSVELGRLTLCPLGGIRLDDLRIAAPGSAGDPWLKVSTAWINVSVLQLLAGQLDPSTITVDGAWLRVLRRGDGTLELADLLRRPRDPSNRASGPQAQHPPVDIRLRHAQITVIDEPNRTRLDLSQCTGLASWQGPQTTVRELSGVLNGGRFDLAAALDQSGDEPAFELRGSAHGVEVGGDTGAVAYLVPVLSGDGQDSAVGGRLDLTLYLSGSGTTREALRQSVVGHATVALDPVDLDHSQLLTRLTSMLDLPEEQRTGSIRSDLTIKQGRIATNDLTIRVASVPIVLSGWTGFDGQLDYRIHAESLARRLPGQARELLSELDVDTSQLNSLRVAGTLQAMELTAASGPPGSSDSRPDAPRVGLDRQKLRDVGRRLRDRVLR